MSAAIHESLPYAAPAPTPSRPILVAAVLGTLALGLITLAGCFLIGVGAMYGMLAPAPVPERLWTNGEIAFVSVLYICCGGCLLGAISLMVVAVRRLMTA